MCVGVRVCVCVCVCVWEGGGAWGPSGTQSEAGGTYLAALCVCRGGGG